MAHPVCYNFLYTYYIRILLIVDYYQELLMIEGTFGEDLISGKRSVRDPVMEGVSWHMDAGKIELALVDGLRRSNPDILSLSLVRILVMTILRSTWIPGTG